MLALVLLASFGAVVTEVIDYEERLGLKIKRGCRYIYIIYMNIYTYIPYYIILYIDKARLFYMISIYITLTPILYTIYDI